MSLQFRIKRRILYGLSVLIAILLYFFHDELIIGKLTLAVAALFVFYATDHLFNVRFSLVHYLYAIAIVTLGVVMSPLYNIYPVYDKVLHYTLPILFSSLVFKTMQNFKIELRWKLLFVFFIVVGTAALFEIGEFAVDQSLDLNTQGVYITSSPGSTGEEVLDPNTDTMIDLIFGTLGAGTFWTYAGLQWSYQQRSRVRAVLRRVMDNRRRSNIQSLHQRMPRTR